MTNFMQEVLSSVQEAHNAVDGTMRGAVKFYRTAFQEELGHLPSVLGKTAASEAAIARKAFEQAITPYCTQMGVKPVWDGNLAFPKWNLILLGDFYNLVVGRIHPCQMLILMDFDAVERTIASWERDIERGNTVSSMFPALEYAKTALKSYLALSNYLCNHHDYEIYRM